MQFENNEAQEQAILQTEGPVLVISCPGSGKTTMLVRRIHQMLDNGVFPETILMMTFTKDAAMEMANKYERFYGKNPGVTFATIHSFCFNVLRNEGQMPNGGVVPENDRMVFLSSILRANGFQKDSWELARTTLTAISACKNNDESYESVTAEGVPDYVFLKLCKMYDEWLEKTNRVDFDDLLLFCRDLFQDKKKVLEKYQKMFTHIQVDEYQDTNGVQRDILYMLTEANRNLCVVGDDDQAIYGFRGADPQIMLDFQKDFPDTAVFHMGINYRSASRVVACASRLIEHNKERFAKPFTSFRGKNGAVGDVVILPTDNITKEMSKLSSLIEEEHKNGIPYNEIAVLFRTNKEAESPATELSMKKIPFYSTEKVQTIYDGIIFCDAIAYTKLSAGIGTNQDLLSILNHPKRYFKEDWFIGVNYTRKDITQRAMQHLEFAKEWQKHRTRDTIDQWMSAFGPGCVSMETKPSEVLRRMRSMGYNDFLREYAKWRNMDEKEMFDAYDMLKADAEKHETMRDWIDSAERHIKMLQEEYKKKDKEGVILTTMHKAKGLEWKTVFILNVDEGKMPHQKSISEEEERRLFYVALTRAKDKAYILSSGKQSKFVRETMEGISAENILFKDETKKSIPKTNRKENISSSVTAKKIVTVASTSTVPKKLAGTHIRHQSFGEGVVDGYEPGIIRIRFKDKVRKFVFPETFQEGMMEYC